MTARYASIVNAERTRTLDASKRLGVELGRRSGARLAHMITSALSVILAWEPGFTFEWHVPDRPVVPRSPAMGERVTSGAYRDRVTVHHGA